MSSSPSPAVLAAFPASVAGVLAFAVLWALTVPIWAALPIAGATAAVVAAVIALSSGGATLRLLDARSVPDDRRERLENVVAGLCTTHGFDPPEVRVVVSEAVNAAAVGSTKAQSHLLLTSGALQRLERVELEAVITRQLCALRRGVEFATTLSQVRRIPLLGSLIVALSRRAGLLDDSADLDIEAVRLTLYPPALASALRKSSQAPDIAAPKAASHLWMCAPRALEASSSPRFSLRERVDVLGEV